MKRLDHTHFTEPLPGCFRLRNRPSIGYDFSPDSKAITVRYDGVSRYVRGHRVCGEQARRELVDFVRERWSGDASLRALLGQQSDPLAYVETRLAEIAEAAAALEASEGQKHDDDKPAPELLPPRALLAVSRVLAFGARKYAPDNWRKVPDGKRRYLAAALRHVLAHMGGEVLDSESSEPHLAHAACCVLFLLELES
jgi:hypothetical protein